MKPLLRRYCILLALLLYWVPNTALPQTPPKVQKIEIKHVGPPAVGDDLIRAHIRVKEGDPYNRPSVDDDVRNLYNTGYFYNIRVTEEPRDGAVVLSYVFWGKPTLMEINFSGNEKYSTTKLRKKLTSKVGEPLDERKLFNDAQEIKKTYQKAGYQKTQVDYVPVLNELTGRGTVTFEIKEAPKVKIEEVIFEGAAAFPERKLRKVIKTRERWFMSWLTGSGVLKDEQFEDDKEKLAEFYREEGYIDFAIKDIQFEQINEKWMNLRFTVHEGQKYNVGQVQIKGPSLFPIEEIQEKLRMIAGETFTPKGLTTDIEAIQDYYGAKGYIDARIVAVKSPNIETGTMDLVYQVEENDKSFLEKVEIKGNDKTKDKVIRRELAVSPGEVFDMTRVKLSKQRLEGLDYFEKVDTTPEPSDAGPNRRNLVVSVEEKSTGNLTFGAGFSTVDNVVGFVELTEGNFDLFNPPRFGGGGQKFRLRTAIGTERQDYQMSFVEPWFLDRKLSLGVDLFHRELSFLSDIFDETHTGGRVSLSRALGSDFVIGTIAYGLENVDIDIVNPGRVTQELLQEAGGRVSSSITASLAYDTRNSNFLPNRGQRSEISATLAGGPLGMDTDTYRFEGRSTWYFPGFFDGHVFEIGGRAGVVDRYSDTDRVPLFDRYFLGGLTSLRGYRFRQVGPRDGINEPIGGSTYWYGTAEYSIPIIERLRFAMFYDIGMVYKDAFSFNRTYDFLTAPGTFATRNTRFFNDNWGVGFRLNLPIGPLRLDYGIPINADPANDGSGRFQFSAGYTREF
jgi:outer membrane protein insertion porin family